MCEKVFRISSQCIDKKKKLKKFGITIWYNNLEEVLCEVYKLYADIFLRTFYFINWGPLTFKLSRNVPDSVKNLHSFSSINITLKKKVQSLEFRWKHFCSIFFKHIPEYPNWSVPQFSLSSFLILLHAHKHLYNVFNGMSAF